MTQEAGSCAHLWELQQAPGQEGEGHGGGNGVFDGASVAAPHPAAGNVAEAQASRANLIQQAVAPPRDVIAGW